MLFADLVGSTELGEDDPERTRLLLDRFFAAMREEVERVGGTVEKFAGDAVMAAFGAPAALEDHAERALHSALAMQSRLDELDRRIELRIGVNTGEVVVDADASSSFVTGDAVNVCARLEQNAEPGQILVGERTVQAARGAFDFGEPLAIDARGKSAPVPCRPLVRALAASRPRGAFARPFVGREHELDQLRRTYERAVADEEPQLAIVTGDAGVGKSRLARELWTWLEGHEARPQLRVGRCLSYGTAITYWPVREILQEHLGLRDEASRDEILARLGERGVLALALGYDVTADLHPLAARDRFRDAWVSLLTDAAARSPVVLLVEDVHWAEHALLELLERTVRDVRGPLLVVATSRPDEGWSGGRRNVTHVQLGPLHADAAAELVADLPEPVRDLLVRRAEGNPFFVEELVESLIDRGVLTRANGHWNATAVPERIATPDSVRGVLAARIDLLPAREKSALQAAAVIGRAFWEGPVRELIASDADFALLEERDFIRPRRESRLEGEREHSIKHALTREVAYAGIPKARRAHLHAAFADWIERRAAGREELAALLAHHYAEAVRPDDADLAWADANAEHDRLRERAVHWLKRAAAAAMSRYELDETIDLLERALELEDGAPERALLWREIGRAHALRYDGEAFWTAMDRSLDVCTDRATCGETYSLLAFQTAIRSGMWKRRPESPLVDGWIAKALELSEPETASRARALIAQAYWHPRNGADAAREGSRIADRLGDADLRSYAWMARAAVAFRALHLPEAAEWALRRFDVADEITDPDHAVEIRETAFPVVAALGRLREIRRLAEEHARLSANLSPHHRMHGVSLLAEADELVGNWGSLVGAEPSIVAAVSENADTPCVRNARCLLLCAVARQDAGDEERSRELERAADELGMEGHGVALDAPRVRLALGRRDVDAVAPLVDAPAKFRLTFTLPNLAARLDGLAATRDRRLEEEAPRFAARDTYLEPFALRALAIVREDEELLDRAQARFAALGLEWHAAQTPLLVRT